MPKLKEMKIGKYRKGNKRSNFLQLRFVETKGGKLCGNYVTLELVNEVGEDLHCNNLITFYEDGKMVLNQCVNPDFPFKLNSRRQLDFKEE